MTTTTITSWPALLIPSVFAAVSCFVAYKCLESVSVRNKRKKPGLKSLNVNADDDLVYETEEKADVSDENELVHNTDTWKGVRMNDPSLLPLNQKEFEFKLKYSLSKWRNNGRRGAWIKLSNNLFHYLPFCIEQEFKIHHSCESYIMLQQWLPQSTKSMIPVYAYSYIGAHAFVLNSKQQMVVIREPYGTHEWKIPGGAVDVNEHASLAAIRETKEETGLDCECLGLLTVRHLLNFRFNCTSDVSFIFVLRPTNETQVLAPIHTNEVQAIKWMDVSDFIENEEHSFLGSEKENLRLLQRSAAWVQKYWNDNTLDSEKAVTECPLMQQYKQTHPFYPKAVIDLYHN